MNDKIYSEQQRLALLLIAWRLPDFITSLIAASVSGLMVVWMEFIENASILIPGLILTVLSRKLNKNLKFKFNYGTGKVEAITALSCEMFDVAGLLCILFFSIRQMTTPVEGRDMLAALGLCLIGLIIDIIIIHREKKLLLQSHSKMLHTAFLSAKKEFGFDVISVVTISVGIVFESEWWMKYFSPAVCIVVCIPFLFVVMHHIFDSVDELIDRTLDEDSQLKIITVLNEFYDSYEELGEIKSRITGEDKYIDIELKFRPDMPYSTVRDTAKQIGRRIDEELGKSSVNIVIR